MPIYIPRYEIGIRVVGYNPVHWLPGMTNSQLILYVA